ncbi:hypothetical protein [Thaumasiovibrio sp. DFM-14]|uniref:hypothetical protein n=1 Tax=Thaumasiovibrio sp. DFM-14 TaxID=3384792 RepID=UPI0039A3DF21
MRNYIAIALVIGTIFVIVFGSKFDLFGRNNTGTFPQLPESPVFNVTTRFDGLWEGRRINMTESSLCKRTTITGSIEDGKALITLTYNNSQLQGWVSEKGELVLYANHRLWDYRFSAIANNNQIVGSWHITNGPCRGTWYLERVS